MNLLISPLNYCRATFGSATKMTFQQYAAVISIQHFHTIPKYSSL